MWDRVSAFPKHTRRLRSIVFPATDVCRNGSLYSHKFRPICTVYSICPGMISRHSPTRPQRVQQGRYHPGACRHLLYKDFHNGTSALCQTQIQRLARSVTRFLNPDSKTSGPRAALSPEHSPAPTPKWRVSSLSITVLILSVRQIDTYSDWVSHY